MSELKNPAAVFEAEPQGLDKATCATIPRKPCNRRVYKFGMTTNPNEAGPGTYLAKCVKVDLNAHYRGAPKIELNFEIIDGYEIGKVARMFFNNPGAKTGEMGSGSKIYQIVYDLYPEKFVDGEADIDLISVLENKVYQITVIETPKTTGGYTRLVDSIQHPETPF